MRLPLRTGGTSGNLPHLQGRQRPVRTVHVTVSLEASAVEDPFYSHSPSGPWAGMKSAFIQGSKDDRCFFYCGLIPNFDSYGVRLFIFHF